MNQVKLNELIKSKMINVPLYVLRIYKDFNLTVDELVLLLFLYDKDGEIFNPNLIAENLKMDLFKVMEIVSNLADKGLINVVTKTNEAKKKEEVIDLSLLFDKITLKMMNEINKMEEKDINIYDVISSEFGKETGMY